MLLKKISPKTYGQHCVINILFVIAGLLQYHLPVVACCLSASHSGLHVLPRYNVTNKLTVR
jgi:hypothetical protein